MWMVPVLLLSARRFTGSFQVRSAVPHVVSVDPGVMALARLAGANTDFSRQELLLDLRVERDWTVVEKAMLETLASPLGGVHLDFADGSCFALEARQRWRFWRRPLTKLA